jgi:hypothetical protein
MACRTLVAYRHRDGRVTLRYAHDGRGLADRLGPETPFGGAAPEPTAPPVDLVGARRPAAAEGRRVHPRPLAVAVPPGVAAASLDPTFDRVVAVGSAFGVSTGVVCSLTLDPDAERAALVVAVGTDPAALRRWFVGAKSLTLDVVASGERDRPTARAALRAALGARAHVHDGVAAFLRAD